MMIWKQEKPFYISGKKVVKEVNNEKGGIPVYYTHSKNSTIELRAVINTGFVTDYSMLMHLYEHLMFHNVKIDDVVYPGITELMAFADKHNININAGTNGNGIIIKVDIENNLAGNMGLSRIYNKPTKHINWLDSFSNNDNVELGFKILSGILYNRMELTEDDIKREMNVVRSEMDSMGTDINRTYLRVHKFILKDSGVVLGKTDDFDRIGEDRVIDIIKTFDKNVLYSNNLSFYCAFDMDDLKDPSAEECELQKLGRKYFNFPYELEYRKPVFELNDDCKHLLYNVRYDKAILNEMKKKDDEVPAIVFAGNLELDLNKYHKPSDLSEIMGYYELLDKCIWDISYGIFNYIREEKQACYTMGGMHAWILSVRKRYINDLINSDGKDYKIHMDRFIPLAENTNVDELASDIKEYLKSFKITKERYEQGKNLILNTYGNIDKAKIAINDIFEYENVFKLAKHLNPDMSEDNIIEELDELSTFDIRKYDYDKLVSIFSDYIKNIKIYKLK